MRDLDTDLLRAFLTIVDAGGFTRAGQRLGRTQATVSLQIKRLEEGLGRALFHREGRAVRLTEEGELLLGYARKILALGAEARSRISEPDIEGVVRLGTPEDFASTHLSEILARFARSHPRVALEIQLDLTLNLMEGFERGRFDLVLAKTVGGERPAASAGEARVWRQPLVWVEGAAQSLEDSAVLPLVLAPQPCVYRASALAALDRLGRPWRVVYSCPSLAGTLAAVDAGLGVTVLPVGMIPPGLRRPADRVGLPSLSDSEIVLRHGNDLTPAARRLGQYIVDSLEAMPAPPAQPRAG